MAGQQSGNIAINTRHHGEQRVLVDDSNVDCGWLEPKKSIGWAKPVKIIERGKVTRQARRVEQSRALLLVKDRLERRWQDAVDIQTTDAPDNPILVEL
jgi:hypothetical protein